MATGTVKWFKKEKGYGFLRAEDGREIFVHVNDVVGGSLRDGQKVAFEVEQTPKGPKAANVVPEGLAMLEVRQVVKADQEGKPPVIVRETGGKVVLPGPGLRGLTAGTPVAITFFDEKEKVIIASGFSLADRMVVRGYQELGYGEEGIILGISMEKKVPIPDLSDLVELRTELNRTSWSAGQTSGGALRYYLIKRGEERTVLGLFIRSHFRWFVLEEMGIWNLHANGPRFQHRGDLKSRQDYEEAWSRYDHAGFRKYVKVFGPWSPDLEGEAPLESSKTEWEILVPHLAAWSEFAAKLEGMRICVGSEGPEELRQYGFTGGWGANHYACLNPLLDQAAQFFVSVSDVTKERVIEFLVQTKSVFPSV